MYTQSRDLKPLDHFPELAEPPRRLAGACHRRREVVIARDGALDFDALLFASILQPRVNMLAAESPASFVAWDLLALGDDDLRDIPQGERRARLESALAGYSRRSTSRRRPRIARTAGDWFQRFEGAGLDGVVAKRIDAGYQPGKRAMLKISTSGPRIASWPASGGTRMARGRTSDRCCSGSTTRAASSTTWASPRRSRGTAAQPRRAGTSA